MISENLFGDRDETGPRPDISSGRTDAEKRAIYLEQAGTRIENLPLFAFAGQCPASLCDLVERPAAGDEFPWADELAGLGPQTRGGFEAVSLAAQMMRKPTPPNDSNTGGVFSHSPHAVGEDALQPPSFYSSQAKPVSSISCEAFLPEGPKHWSESDLDLFRRLPQGGGGVDWLKVRGTGHFTDRGWCLIEALKMAKKYMGKKDGAVERCAELGLQLIEHKYREHMVFAHPLVEGVNILVRQAADGVGRNYHPLILLVNGFKVCCGRIRESLTKEGKKRGPIFSIEATGMPFLRYGERGVFKRFEDVLDGLGIVVEGLTSASRIDFCADLPGATVDEFVRIFHAGGLVTKAKRGAVVNYSLPDKKNMVHAETITLMSKAVSLTIYDKLKEAKLDETGEKIGLLEQNRWGGPVESAVRVEWSFNLGKSKSKKYACFFDLFQGMSDLLGWAMNNWARFVLVTDRTHTTRAKYSDVWLRTLHAFAFWAGNLDYRSEPPAVASAPPLQLMRTGAGFLAAALGRSGINPEDDFTVFSLMAGWLGANALAAKCRAVAALQAASHGTEQRILIGPHIGPPVFDFGDVFAGEACAPF